jgi:hypothetical protein
MSDDESSTTVSESWVLPLVVKLGGVPTVSEGGDILYAFPDLMSTTKGAHDMYLTTLLLCLIYWLLESKSKSSSSLNYVKEVSPSFSNAEPFNLGCAAGTVNIFLQWLHF